MDNPLWHYSLNVYPRDGVEELLLRLQDDCALDVNILLYAAWLGGQGIALTQAHCEQVLAATKEWREAVVAPLRGLRRQLRGIEAAQAVRARVKALELESEEEQQRLIYACHRAAGLTPGGGTVAENLALVAAGSSAPAAQWRPLLEKLAPLLAP
ncbi:MAG: TIGR02444 family protein [Halioglobus sp.]|nr:TIGR02444 family protein [Halioglobus sp.]